MLVVVLNLASDATTIGSVTDRVKDGTDVVDETSLGLRVGVVHGRLDNVVGVGVAEKLLEINRVHNLIDESASGVLVASANRLLDDVGTELLSGEDCNVAEEALSERLGEGRLTKVEDVLYNIVAERILNKSEGVHGDVLNKLTLLVARSMIDTALENTAAMTMSADNDTASANSVKDELGVLGGQMVEALLDDVVAVEILDERNDFVSQSLGDDLDLLGGRDELDHLLQSASTVLVESNLDHRGCGCADEDSALIVVGVLEELLAEVVAEGVCVEESAYVKRGVNKSLTSHQLDHVRVGLLEDESDVLSIAFFELLLQVATAVLILAKAIDLANDILQIDIEVARVV